MKPIHLSLQAFGAFAGTEEIDFESLAPRGLFLVSGSTGAGKTTIFDAMCWALYGTMPLKDAGGVRSDHVDDTVRCEVSFTFERSGTRYTVTRNPEQLRPSLRGGGHANEPASAHLVRHDRDGTTSIATKSRDVTSACEDLIGLDAIQFQRVVLLPQGDFSQFLLARTDAREAILEKIFGGEIFERITKELKDDRERLETELGSVEVRGREQLQEAARHLDETDRILTSVDRDDPTATPDHTAPRGDGDGEGEGEENREDADTGKPSEGTPVDPEGTEPIEPGTTVPDETDLETAEPDAGDEELDAERLGQRVEDVRRRLETLEHRVNRADERRQQADRDHRAATDAAGRFDRAATHHRALAELDANEPEIRRRETDARESAAARPILNAHHGLRSAEDNAETAEERLAQRRGRLHQLFTSLDAGIDVEAMGPSELSRTLEEHRRRATERRELLDAHRTAVAEEKKAGERVGELEARLTQLAEELRTRTDRRGDIEAELPDHRAAAIDLTSLDEQITTADERLRTRAELDRAEAEHPVIAETAISAADRYRALLGRFVETQAPRLAAELADGEPCPVCGSAEHPDPAVDAGGDEIDFEAVEAASTVVDRTREALGKAETRIEALRGRLGDDVDTDIATLRERRRELENRRKQADAAHQAVQRLETELETLRAAIGTLEQRAAGAEAELAGARTRLHETTDARTAAEESTEGIDPDTVTRHLDVVGRIEKALTGFDGLTDAVTAARSTVHERRGVLDGLLADSDHADLDSVRAAVLDEETERRAIEAARTHDRIRSETTALLRELNEEGVPEERPDVDATRAALDRATLHHGHLSEQSIRARGRLDAAGDALRTHAEELAGTEDLRRRTDLARIAHQVCQTGRGDLRVSLKRWVLSRELDRITAMANQHLAAMTGSRFALHRVEEQSDRRSSFGLDLEVFDANTGRRRSPSSLSGGEQFQASLALALGLADVIGHGGTASGRSFEALFVDEGFGSLSADALEEAVETLMGLQESGRMVGAITHVEAMKESLHVGIEVRHADDRPGSTLVVHP